MTTPRSTDPPAGDPTVRSERRTDPAPPGYGEAAEEDLVSKSGFKPVPGGRMGRYRLGARIGSGGMGIVFEADDTKLKRRVAIKFLRTTLTASHESFERFMREAQTASQIDHPNVVATYDVADHDGLFYLVLELLEPRSTKDFILSEGAMHWTEATQVIADACRALVAAHAIGLIHRDIKPDNILRSRKGIVKITDFGLAKDITADLSLTQQGRVLGTPHYMSPEQCQGEPIDARGDIYALGGTFYALLTGDRPFNDKHRAAELLYAHCAGPVPDPGDKVASLPDPIRAIVRRAMEKKAADRYADANAMLAALEAALALAPADAPPPRFLLPGAPSRVPSSTILPPVDSKETSANAASSGSPVGSQSTSVVVAPSRRWILGALAGAAAVGVGGFWLASGPLASNEAPAVSSDPSAGAAPTPALAPIQVGVLHSLSGTMAISEQGVADATLLAIDELNEAGGVLGRRIEPIVADGRSDWPTFAQEAERLLTASRVPVVFGGWTSASRKTMRPVFEQHGGLLFYPVQYEGLEQSPNIVYTGAAPNQQILPALKWCTGYLGARKFFLVGSDYVFPRTANAIIRDALAGQGVEIVGEEYLLLGATGAGPIVEKIEAAKPDVILNTINGDSNIAFFRVLRDAGITPHKVPTVSFSVGEDELRQIRGLSLAGDYLAWNYFASVDRSENLAFIERFRKKYGPYRITTDPMEAAYFGVHLWALAADKAGTTDVAAVRKALPELTYAAPGTQVRIDAQNQHTWKVFRLGKVAAAGNIDIVFSTEAPIAPEPFPKSRTPAEWESFLQGLYVGWGNRWANPGEAKD